MSTQASACKASVTNGIFKRLDTLGFARASTVMSTNSASGFKWSVKLIGTSHFTVGIASQLNRGSVIHDDQNAIVYVSDSRGSDTPCIKRGSTTIHTDLKEVQTGDVISFEFQPDTKKLIIDWVRNENCSSINL